MSLRIVGSRRELERREDCAFYRDGFCLLDDRQCVKLSRNAMRRYDGFEQRDYLELHWRRRQRFQDLWLHTLSLSLSLAAVILSCLTLVHSGAQSKDSRLVSNAGPNYSTGQTVGSDNPGGGTLGKSRSAPSRDGKNNGERKKSAK